jgi:hypothetical protein
MLQNLRSKIFLLHMLQKHHSGRSLKVFNYLIINKIKKRVTKDTFVTLFFNVEEKIIKLHTCMLFWVILR